MVIPDFGSMSDAEFVSWLRDNRPTFVKTEASDATPVRAGQVIDLIAIAKNGDPR